MNMRTEAIRLPVWAATVLSVAVLPFVVDLLTGVDWRAAMAAAIAAVIPLLAGVEVLRAFTDSPATRARRTNGTVDEGLRRLHGEAGQTQLVTVLLAVLVVVVILILVGVL